MARRHKSLQIISTAGQKFACRDCPARCCTAPWAYPVSEQERERILGDDLARERMGERGQAILRAGVLPTRVRKRGLACVFLDEDNLCSLQKRHGHDFLPGPCQAFPFGFSHGASGEVIALTSRYCPSIRENYGDPLSQELLRDKLHQAGGAAPLAEKMGLRSGRVLPRSHYLKVVERWSEALAEGSSAPQVLAELFDWTEAVDCGLPSKKNPDEQEFSQLLRETTAQGLPELAARRPGFNGRMLIAHLLGSISFPARQMLAHRLSGISWSEKWANWWMRLRWLLGWGRVDLLFIERPVKLSAIEHVQPVFSGAQGPLVSSYLVEILRRRQGMSRQTYLHRVLVDLGLMTALISRYARAYASAEGLHAVQRAHVQEAIGIAELLFTHQGEGGQGLVLQQLRMKLISDREAFRHLLAAEI